MASMTRNVRTGLLLGSTAFVLSNLVFRYCSTVSVLVTAYLPGPYEMPGGLDLSSLSRPPGGSTLGSSPEPTSVGAGRGIAQGLLRSRRQVEGELIDLDLLAVVELVDLVLHGVDFLLQFPGHLVHVVLLERGPVFDFGILVAVALAAVRGVEGGEPSQLGRQFPLAD